ncbi:hypothetical protein GCM10007170_31150 [Arthrobacter liuii]|uniref:DUF222 domain-containing protein n=1 Tax=Arthrobacter liuii TaxID=1476996 RepID=A0ABQ2AUZ3_9MICC|nr:hypothetical protein GCM10007170_31150 [Arthrobacter liuii]
MLDELAAQLGAVALAAPDLLAAASHTEAADYAARVEGFARSMEYLQFLAAGAVDRTRTQATSDAGAAKTRSGRSCAGQSTGWITGWNANGIETLYTTPTAASGTGAVSETDAAWPGPPSRAARPMVASPADDGCRNTAEFLRLRLQIPIREARRRLTLPHHVLPTTTITGEPLPPTRPHLAAALTPASANSTETGTTTDPDFLTRVAQRWTDTIDADGTEPTEEALRHTQGAFIRKPRRGLHHLEIFATTDQCEHLLTVMNTATNPRTTPNTGTGGIGIGSGGTATGTTNNGVLLCSHHHPQHTHLHPATPHRPPSNTPTEPLLQTTPTTPPTGINTARQPSSRCFCCWLGHPRAAGSRYTLSAPSRPTTTVPSSSSE